MIIPFLFYVSPALVVGLLIGVYFHSLQAGCISAALILNIITLIAVVRNG